MILAVWRLVLLLRVAGLLFQGHAAAGACCQYAVRPVGTTMMNVQTLTGL